MYPAYEAFGKDIRVGFARWKVYMAIQPPVLSFGKPREIKVEVVRRMARTSTRATIAALNWLEQAGYIEVHRRRPRLVTLSYDDPTPDISPPASSQGAA